LFVVNDLCGVAFSNIKEYGCYPGNAGAEARENRGSPGERPAFIYCCVKIAAVSMGKVQLRMGGLAHKTLHY